MKQKIGADYLGTVLWPFGTGNDAAPQSAYSPSVVDADPADPGLNFPQEFDFSFAFDGKCRKS